MCQSARVIRSTQRCTITKKRTVFTDISCYKTPKRQTAYGKIWTNDKNLHRYTSTHRHCIRINSASILNNFHITSASLRVTSHHFRINPHNFASLLLYCTSLITYICIAIFTRYPQLEKTMVNNTPATFLQQTKRVCT